MSTVFKHSIVRQYRRFFGSQPSRHSKRFAQNIILLNIIPYQVSYNFILRIMGTHTTRTTHIDHKWPDLYTARGFVSISIVIVNDTAIVNKLQTVYLIKSYVCRHNLMSVESRELKLSGVYTLENPNNFDTCASAFAINNSIIIEVPLKYEYPGTNSISRFPLYRSE